MRVHLAFVEYDETIGIFSKRLVAEQMVIEQCRYNHDHNDQNRCGVTTYTLDELIPSYVDPLNR